MREPTPEVRAGKSAGRAVAAAAGATLGALLVLDLTWLGVIARGLYDSALAPLKRDAAFLPAAGLFYLLYIGAVVVHAVLGARSPGSAARRGALMGLFAYGTYDLTNWAVLRGWPAWLVPIDIAWGMCLTALAALAGRLVYERVRAGA